MVAQTPSHPHCLDFRSYRLLRPLVALENRRRDNLESNLCAVGEKREEHKVFSSKKRAGPVAAFAAGVVYRCCTLDNGQYIGHPIVGTPRSRATEIEIGGFLVDREGVSRYLSSNTWSVVVSPSHTILEQIAGGSESVMLCSAPTTLTSRIFLLLLSVALDGIAHVFARLSMPAVFYHRKSTLPELVTQLVHIIHPCSKQKRTHTRRYVVKLVALRLVEIERKGADIPQGWLLRRHPPAMHEWIFNMEICAEGMGARSLSSNFDMKKGWTSGEKIGWTPPHDEPAHPQGPPSPALE